MGLDLLGVGFQRKPATWNRVVAGTVLPTRALGVDPPIVHYERRRPEESVLYQTLARDLESFVSDAERVLPYFVKRELRDFQG